MLHALSDETFCNFSIFTVTFEKIKNLWLKPVVTSCQMHFPSKVFLFDGNDGGDKSPWKFWVYHGIRLITPAGPRPFWKISLFRERNKGQNRPTIDMNPIGWSQKRLSFEHGIILPQSINIYKKVWHFWGLPKSGSQVPQVLFSFAAGIWG